MPTALIPRTQIGSVARQTLQMYPLCSSSAQIFTNRAPPMNRRSIPDDQQAFPRLAQQVLQEHDTMLARQRFRAHQRIQLPRRGCACHHRQMISAQSLVDDRRLAFRSIRLDHTRQQVKARFVHKYQGSALTRRFPQQLRPNLDSPVFDRCFVPLDRWRIRDLRGPAQSFHQTRNMVLVVGHSEFHSDNLSDTSTSPNVAAKTIGLGSIAKKLGDPSQLRRRQFRRSSGGRVPNQCLGSPSVCCRQPSANRALVDAERFGNIDLQPAAFVQFKGPKPSPFRNLRPEMAVFIHPLMLRKVAPLAQLSVTYRSSYRQHGVYLVNFQGKVFWMLLG